MYKIREALGLSEIGKRSANEDAIYPILVKDEMTTELKKQVPEIEGLYVVCDGVGGANKGEIAAFLTTVNFPVYFANRKPAQTALSGSYLQDGVRFIEKALDTFTAQNPYAAGMACTLTLLYFNEFGANIAWAGDSRVYHIREGNILYQTYDHSYVNELVRIGQITQEEAQYHKQKNVILRAIQGSENPTEIELHTIPWADIQTGDIFMLCSDGITETFSNEKLSISFETHKHLEHLLSTISQNCEMHSRDNYSCYLVEIGEKVQADIEDVQTAFLPPVIPEQPEVTETDIEKTAFLTEEVAVEQNIPTELVPVEEEVPAVVAEVEMPEIEISATPVEIQTPEVEVPTLVEEVEMPQMQAVSATFISENSDKTAAYEAEKIASLLDKIQANLPQVPSTEEQMPVFESKTEIPKIDTPKVETPVIPPVSPQPQVNEPAYTPEPKPSKAFPIVMFLAGIAVLLLVVSGVLWYYVYGPGTENKRFKNYYENAQEKVKQCESNGRCLEAKGAVNQAKDAAETPDEFKKVEDLMVIIRKKEDEVMQKDRLLSPEPMDKGKVETGETPKSPTATPKAPTNVPPSKEVKTDVKPADTKATTTTPPKTDTKPVDSKGTAVTPKPVDTKANTTPPKTEPKPTTAPKVDTKPTDNKATTTPKPQVPTSIKAGEPAPPTKPPKTPKVGGE